MHYCNEPLASYNFTKICQIFISKMSTISDLTNQIMIPGAGVIERRHQYNVYRLPRFVRRLAHAPSHEPSYPPPPPSPKGFRLFVSFFLKLSLSKDSLFAGRCKDSLFSRSFRRSRKRQPRIFEESYFNQLGLVADKNGPLVTTMKKKTVVFLEEILQYHHITSYQEYWIVLTQCCTIGLSRTAAPQ